MNEGGGIPVEGPQPKTVELSVTQSAVENGKPGVPTKTEKWARMADAAKGFGDKDLDKAIDAFRTMKGLKPKDEISVQNQSTPQEDSSNTNSAQSPDNDQAVIKDLENKVAAVKKASPPPTAKIESGGSQNDINNLEAKVAEAQKFDLEAEMKRKDLIIETDNTGNQTKKEETKTETPSKNQQSNNAVPENNPQSQNPPVEKNSIQDKNTEQPKDKADQVTEKGEEKQKIIMEAIESEPGYQEILLTLTNKESYKDVSVQKLKKDAFDEFKAMVAKDKIREAEIKEGVRFNPEQEKIYKKEFQKAFQDHPTDMLKATKQAMELAKAKSYAEMLSKEQNVAQEQISKASEVVNKLQKNYDITTEKIIARLLKEGTQSPLISLLRDVPKDPRLLEIMKKEKTNSLIKLIGLLVAMVSLPVVDEIKKAAIPSQEQ